MAKALDQSSLYDTDYVAWLQEQVAHLRANRLAALDLENVALELEGLMNSQRQQLENRLEVLIHHLLKWDHQPGRRSRSWSLTIEEHRLRVATQLRKNPGLKSRLAEAVEDGFRLGRMRTAREMKFDVKTLPVSCPYDWDAIMHREFISNRP